MYGSVSVILENLHKRLLDNLKTGVVFLDSELRFIYINAAAQALLESKGNGFREQDTLNFSAGMQKDNLSIMIWGKNINDDRFNEALDIIETSLNGLVKSLKNHNNYLKQ